MGEASARSSEIAIVCKCGEEWTGEHWPELPLVGRYQAGRDGVIEIRSCVCGATLTLPAEGSGARTPARTA